VWVRYGGRDDAEGAREGIIAWMQSMPSGIEGRRQMPNFDLSDQDLNALVDFLEWTSRIDTQGWPPNEAG
ncbi:MAG: c-type cytochrome, partial [Geminicoccaceae bacterium]